MEEFEVEVVMDEKKEKKKEEISKKAESVGPAFLPLINKKKYSDIIFLVGEEEVPMYAHKVILAARSPYFDRMFDSGMKETHSTQIKKPNSRPEQFLKVLKFIYSGEVDKDSPIEEALEFILTLEEICMGGLDKLCESYLFPLITHKNAWHVLTHCAQHGATAIGGVLELIQKHCKEYVAREAEALVLQKEFLTLPEDILISLLQSDGLNIPEVDLFKALCRWANTNSSPEGKGKAKKKGRAPKRAKKEIEVDTTVQNHMNSVLPYIRFNLMNAKELLEVVEPADVVPQEILYDAFKNLALKTNLSSLKRRTSDVIQENDTTFSWKVRNFSSRKLEMESSVFQYDGLPWNFLLFPLGDRDDAKDHLSAFLELSDPAAIANDDEVGVQIHFQLWIKTQLPGLVSGHYGDATHTFTATQVTYGFPKLVSRVRVMDPAEGFLSDDTILLVVKFMK